MNTYKSSLYPSEKEACEVLVLSSRRFGKREYLNETREARQAFLFLIAFMHWAYAGYTLKRDGWHRTFTEEGRRYSVYQFSRNDGVRLLVNGEAPF